MKNRRKIVGFFGIGIFFLMCFACDSFDDVVPLDNKVSNKKIKLADPKVLTAQEIAEVNAIKQEYLSSTNN